MTNKPLYSPFTFKPTAPEVLSHLRKDAVSLVDRPASCNQLSAYRNDGASASVLLSPNSLAYRTHDAGEMSAAGISGQPEKLRQHDIYQMMLAEWFGVRQEASETWSAAATVAAATGCAAAAPGAARAGGGQPESAAVKGHPCGNQLPARWRAA